MSRELTVASGLRVGPSVGMKTAMRRIAPGVALIVWLLALPGGIGGADGKGSKVVVREVLPSATDAAIDKFSGEGWDHCVYYQPSSAKKHQLLVLSSCPARGA